MSQTLALTLLVSTAVIGGSTAQMNQSYDPVLGELADSEDPSSFAESRGLIYENGTVKIVLELEPNKQIPEGYRTEVVQKYDSGNTTLVEARVPVNSLRSLAAEANVNYIRAPSTPVATGSSTDGNATTLNDTDEGDGNRPGENKSGENTPGFTTVSALSAVAVLCTLRWLR